jgi:hypothetical protein
MKLVFCEKHSATSVDYSGMKIQVFNHAADFLIIWKLQKDCSHIWPRRITISTDSDQSEVLLRRT